MPTPETASYIDFPGRVEPLPPPPVQADKIVQDGPSVPLQNKKPESVISVSVSGLSETAVIGQLSTVITGNPSTSTPPLGTAVAQSINVVQNNPRRGNNTGAGGVKNSAAPVLSSNTKSTAAGNFN
jgi:hypothetical protein